MGNNNVRLAIAPIGWTNDDLPELGGDITFEQCISEMALAGFTGSEVGNKYPKDTKVLKEYLDLRNLSICNAWFSTYFADGKKEETIKEFIKHRDFLYEMGAKVIGCSEQSLSIQGTDLPVIKEKPTFNEEQWNLIKEGYNEIAVLAEEKGMKVCLHHHMGTGIQTPSEIDKFLNITNDNVYLLFDTGHIYFSEQSQKAVEDLIEKHFNSIVHIHLKDVRKDIMTKVINEDMSFLTGVKKGVFTVPGDGDIDFTKVFEIIEKRNYEGWLVVEAEQDPYKANPLKYAKMAREFIKQNINI